MKSHREFAQISTKTSPVVHTKHGSSTWKHTQRLLKFVRKANDIVEIKTNELNWRLPDDTVDSSDINSFIIFIYFSINHCRSNVFLLSKIDFFLTKNSLRVKKTKVDHLSYTSLKNS